MPDKLYIVHYYQWHGDGAGAARGGPGTKHDGHWDQEDL